MSIFVHLKSAQRTSRKPLTSIILDYIIKDHSLQKKITQKFKNQENHFKNSDYIKSVFKNSKNQTNLSAKASI